MRNTIPAMFDHACEQYPHKEYLAEKTANGWQVLSYLEAREHIHCVAAALLHKGIRGSIAIISEGRPSWVIMENATFIAGGFSVPLSIKLSAEEIAFRLEHAKVQAICCSRLTHEKTIQAVARLGEKPAVICLDQDPEVHTRLLAAFPVVHCWSDLLGHGRDLLKDPANRKAIADSAAAIGPDDVATVSYTSGTTGNPKGIMLTQSNYYHNCRQSLDGFPMPFGWRMFVILPIDHAFAHTIALYAALLQQFSLYFVDARGGAMGILRNIPVNMKETRPDLILTVPSLTTNFMQKISDNIRDKGGLAWAVFRGGLKARIFMNGTVFHRPAWYRRILPFFPAALAELLVFRKVREFFGGNLKLFIGGGAHLDIKQQEFFRAIGIPVFQGYGLTEAAPVISTNNRGMQKIGTSGPVLPGIACRILDADLNPLPPEAKGQIAIRGPNVMKGYLFNEEATKAAFTPDGWLLTGDLGLMDRDGFLHVIGREKALLISSDGEKYSPEEIEDAIVSSSSYISACMLWCDHRNYTVALITLRSDELARTLRAEGYRAGNPDEACIERALALVIKDFQAYTSDPSYRDLFPAQWKPAGFLVVPRSFNEADGTINSTMKMVRGKVFEHYRDLVMAQYEPGMQKPDNPRNRELLRQALSD